MRSRVEARGWLGGAFGALAIGAAGLLGLPTSAAAAAFFQSYEVNSDFDVYSIVLYQQTVGGGGTTNSFETYAGSTVITDPFPKTQPITGTFFLGVSVLGSQDETPDEHLVLAFNDAFAAGLISGGQDFADIFTGFDESSLIGALKTLSSSESTQVAIDDASDLIFNFSDEVTGLGGLFGSVDTFSMVSFSTASEAGGGRSFITAASAAPEPNAWALMILGFGGAGAVLRRRRTPDARAAA